MSGMGIGLESGLINIALLFLLAVTAFAIILARNLMVAVILLAIFSLQMAVLYSVLAAPDVAMTEAAVGAGVSTVLFLAALISVGIHTPPRSIKRVLLPLIVVLITGTALVYILEDMPSYGDAHAPPHTHVVPYYLQQTQADIDIPNIVTAILADYRGYDTLGETAVVFLAAISVLLLLSDNKENTEDEADE